MIKRTLQQNIVEQLFKGKAILLFGPRQTGKTTLCEMIASGRTDVLWLNGDEPDIRQLLDTVTSTRLKQLFGSKKLIIIDEAQRIRNVGLTLKLITDQIKDVQVIATGSSALDLSSEIKEPLTGRKVEFLLLPLSFEELSRQADVIDERRSLEHRLVFGYYPEVVSRPGEETGILKLLSDSYLYKDLFALEKIKRPALLEKLVRALALQLGSEVSYNEIAQLIGADKETVERYIDLLEKAFVVFRLPALSGNVRNEIKKGKKIYFRDNGIRNAVINNFNPFEMRTDRGPLFENFLISERIKLLNSHRHLANSYFWRTAQQQEVDYIEESGGAFSAYEFKLSPRRKVRFPKSFLKGYPGSPPRVIHPENLQDFLLWPEE